MEGLYRILFQADESWERERQVNALCKECDRYARHTQSTPLWKECGCLNMRDDTTGVGSFDIQTRLALWKNAAMAWQDGWPKARASAGNVGSEDAEEEAPNIVPLPKASVKDLGDGRYKFRGHKVQAASLEEAHRLLDDAYSGGAGADC